MLPPLELDYIKPSPSRTKKLAIPARYIYGRGQGVGFRKLPLPKGETGVGLIRLPRWQARLGSPYGGAVAAGD